MKEKVLITGANGHLGKKLILASDEYDICALVRSEKAERDLMNFIEGHNKKNVEIIPVTTRIIKEVFRILRHGPPQVSDVVGICLRR